jgi:hypothetical protein
MSLERRAASVEDGGWRLAAGGSRRGVAIRTLGAA